MSTTATRTAVVTGSSGGLGQAIVSRLAADGMRVVAADIQPERGEIAEQEALTAAVDVTDAQSVARLISSVKDRWGPVAVLINNAGIAGPTAAVDAYPTQEWRRVLDVNLTGAFHCMKACLPDMVTARYGRIINIASIAGKEGNPWMSAYSASKAGLIALTKSAAKEVATLGVLINSVVPGVMESGLTEAATDEERRLFLSRVPMGRMGRAEELAELVSWLSSERCSFSTGATYDLSGGRAVY